MDKLLHHKQARKLGSLVVKERVMMEGVTEEVREGVTEEVRELCKNVSKTDIGRDDDQDVRTQTRSSNDTSTCWTDEDEEQMQVHTLPPVNWPHCLEDRTVGERPTGWSAAPTEA